MHLIDTHCHLDLADFDADREQVLAAARAGGVRDIVVPAVDRAGWPKLLALCAGDAGLHPALGLHPVHLDRHAATDSAALVLSVAAHRPVAIGEIGLDYCRATRPAERHRQRALCTAQLAVARDLGLPALLHVRRAHDDMLALLRQGRVTGGIAHAFNGSLEQAGQYLDLGFRLGFGGMLTFGGCRRVMQRVGHSLGWAWRLAPLLLVLLALAPLGDALAQAPADAVVKLRAEPPGASPRTGSGFVVGRDADWLYILTAAHVVEGVPRAGVVFGTRRQARPLPAEVRHPQYWDERGLALLRMAVDALPAAVPPRLSLADPGRVPGGAELLVLGHPPRLGDWSILRGILANRQGETLKVQVPVDEGNSGGPVLLDGRVVGMVVAEERGIAIVKSVVNLRNYLDGFGLLGLDGPVSDFDTDTGPDTEPDPEPDPEPGDTFRDCDDCPEMVVIPAGEFLMGSPDTEPERDADEGPVHRVRFARPFALGVHEVTVAQFRAFVEAEGYRTEAERGDGCHAWTGSEWKRDSKTSWRSPSFEQQDDHPVVCVSWNDARAYARWLAEETGAQYRLPSEAEWEYAARAGTKTPFWTGHCIHTDQANYNGNYDYADCGAKTGVYRRRTVAAGSLPANPFGLHEVAGNAWEWVEDCWHGSFTGAPSDGGAWLEAKGGECARVVRGGSWSGDARVLRASTRDRGGPSDRGLSLGFRLARTF